MAQLSSDCFSAGMALLRLDAALDDLAARLGAVAAPEEVALGAACGRVLADDVVAPAAVPGFDNSAVDGYAVRHADLAGAGETRLPISVRIPAGTRGVAPLAPGSAARIFTGAMMPPGADTVFMQEDVRVEGDHVRLPPGLAPGANRRFAGEDFAAGAVALRAGTRLRPQHVAALAALGLGRVHVRRPLRVGLFSTGDEVVEPGSGPLPPGAQFDSNRPMLAGLLAARGMEPVDLGILPDNRDAIARALAAAAERCEALVTSGGVSTGEEDHVKAAVEAAGRLNFWRLAIKPGRPIAMGTIAGRPFLGMPGNPAAVFVTFTRFVGPVLDLLAGAAPVRPMPVPAVAGFAYRKKAERREYVRVSLVRDAERGVIARLFPRDGAALVSSLTESDGFVELGEECLAVAPGDAVGYLPFAALLA
ncbi:MAG: gephyrin-like molybdotransferase Glp [Rhabdaerophilum calidifontis]